MPKLPYRYGSFRRILQIAKEVLRLVLAPSTSPLASVLFYNAHLAVDCRQFAARSSKPNQLTTIRERRPCLFLSRFA